MRVIVSSFYHAHAEFMTIALFSSLGLIKKDSSFRNFFPKSILAKSGTQTYLTNAFGRKMSNLEIYNIFKSLLQHMPEDVTMLDIENVACKAKMVGFHELKLIKNEEISDGNIECPKRLKLLVPPPADKSLPAPSDKKVVYNKEEVATTTTENDSSTINQFSEYYHKPATKNLNENKGNDDDFKTKNA